MTVLTKMKAGARRLWHELNGSAFEKGRWVLLYVTSFVFGNAIYFGLSFEPDHSVLAAICLTVAGLAVGMKGLSDIAARASWGMLCFFVGIGYAQQSTALVDTKMLTKEGWYTIEGTVETIEKLPAAVRVRLFDVVPVQDDRQRATPEGSFPNRIRLRSAGRDFSPTIGDRVRLRARLSSPSPPVAPGAFDFQRWA